MCCEPYFGHGVNCLINLPFMKNNFGKLVIFGFVINVMVVLTLAWIYIFRIDVLRELRFDAYLDWTALVLFVLSFVLLIVVYLIIRAQLKAKDVSAQLLFDNKQLLLSIIDNTTNPISIKKINGEYLLINKQFEQLFNITGEAIKGKTDHDFLAKEIADAYRNSDLDVIKAGKEIKVEETIVQPEGIHTYIAVKFPLHDATGRIYAIGSISTDITDRKETERSLKAGETFFNMSLDSLIISSREAFLTVNPATLKTLGYTEKELVGKPFMSFVHPEDVEKTKNEVTKLESGSITVNFENRYLCKDGNYKWLNWTTYPDTKTGLLYAVARDVTENKQYEESLKAGDNFFKMSWDILVIATKENFIKFNPSLIRVLGYTEKEMLEQPFVSFIFPGDIEATKKELEGLQNGVATIHFKNRWICKDTSIKWLDWTATADPVTDLLYAVAQDITNQMKLEDEQKQALVQLYENEQKLKLILENINDGVIVTDTERKVVLANYMANNLLGIEMGKQIPENFNNKFELYFPDETTIFPAQNLPIDVALRGESTDNLDVVLWNTESKEKKRLLLSGRPILDQENQVFAAVITVKDISRYKQLEQELKESEMNYRRAIGFKTEEQK